MSGKFSFEGDPMNWKKLIAREWLWLMSIVLCVLICWEIYMVIIGEYSNFWIDWGRNTVFIFLGPIALVYFVRLTLWSIRQFKD